MDFATKGDDDLPSNYFDYETVPDEGVVEEDNLTTSSQVKKKKKTKVHDPPDLGSYSKYSLSCHILERIKRFQPKLSSLELGRYQQLLTSSQAKSSCFLEIPSFASHVAAGIIENSPRFQVLVLASSAIRCLEIIKSLQLKFKDNYRLLKLFGKHLKLSEQVDTISKGFYHVAVGTPARALAVLKEIKSRGIQSADSLRVLAIDIQRDVKKKSIFDIPENLTPLQELLLSNFSEKISKGDLEILYFK